MKAETTRGNLYIEFQHVHPRVTPTKMGIPQEDWGKFTNQGSAGTYCSIKQDDRNGTIIAQGQSIIHPVDVHSFNKEKGRTIALAKALYNLFPGRSQKENRTAVWEAYHNRTNA